MELIKNNDYTVEIFDVNENGFGIGKIDDFVVFVDGVLAGETVLIKLVKIKKSFGYGKLLKIVRASSERVEPACHVFKQCGGCCFQHFDYSAQLKLKTKFVKDALERIGGFRDIHVMDTIGMKNPYNYRNKAQFPVGISGGELVFGFYKPRSHSIVSVSSCVIQNSVNEKIISIIKAFMLQFHIKPYDEKNYSGIVRHIVTRVGSVTKQVMVCIVINGKKLPHADALAEKLKEVPQISTIVINYNSAKTNAILGSEISILYGDGFIYDYIDEFKFEISPLSFFQVNSAQTSVLYQTALDFAGLSGTETVIDAYCGIGTISLFLSEKAKFVFGVEVVPQAIRDAVKNAQINHVSNVKFILGKSEEIIPDLCRNKDVYPDVLVLDPPRKGCAFKLIEMIKDVLPAKIVYVSCNPSTLARDLSFLSEFYDIGRVQPVDMFCFTGHVETVVLLRRKEVFLFSAT